MATRLVYLVQDMNLDPTWISDQEGSMQPTAKALFAMPVECLGLLAAALWITAGVPVSAVELTLPIRPVLDTGAVEARPEPLEATPVNGPHHSKRMRYSLLWDQGNLSADSAVTAQNFESAFDDYDAEGGDDFVVDATEGWTVHEVIVYGSYSEGGGPADSVNIAFYADGGGLPSSNPSCSRIGSIVSDQGGVLMVSLSQPCELAHGAHWLGGQVTMDFDTEGQWYWSVSDEHVGNLAHWRNPGDGFGHGCVDWTPLGQCIDNGGNSYRFQILGESNGGQQLPTDGTWTYFSWDDGPGAFNTEGPFTFDATTSGSLDVTDAALAGDRFEVYDHDSLIGMTSAPTGTVGDYTSDPDLAFASPLWSSGRFPLGAGAHSITIRNIQIPPGHPSGGGYLRWRSLLFEDGFESGDTTAWSTTVP